MTFKHLGFAMAALASAMVVSTCAFAVTVETTNFLSSPTYFNGFEGFTGTYAFQSPTVATYSEGAHRGLVSSASITAALHPC
jgi:hypothetical protein